MAKEGTTNEGDKNISGSSKLMIDLNVDWPSNFDCSSDDDTNIDFESDSNDADGNTIEDDLVGNQQEDVIRDEPELTNVENSLPSLILRMTFESHDKVIFFYHEFGRQNGFQMKIRSREKDRLRLTCSKEGKFTPKGKDPSKPSRTQVTGCNAKITAIVDKTGKWKLSTVVLEHNYPLDPIDSRLMPNYRFINPHNKEAILTNEKTGVPIDRNFTTFVVRYGGFGSVPFTEKYCRNLISKHRRLSLEEGDFAAMEKLFLELSSKDKDFFYMYDTYDSGTIRNVFWANGRCRAAYRDFGDVVSFDTTYLKNRYRMPFSPFIGVNHHGQSILLGCALLSGEEMSNYVWLFKTWVACMSGKAPRGILTDQAKAIGNGIKEILPQTKHRWCIWHIMRNAKKHFNQYIEKKAFHKDLRSVLHDSLSVIEFEERWRDVGEIWVARLPSIFCSEHLLLVFEREVVGEFEGQRRKNETNGHIAEVF